jgi:hypothetical protein
MVLLRCLAQERLKYYLWAAVAAAVLATLTKIVEVFRAAAVEVAAASY